MSVLAVLALLAGFLASLGALWVDHAVSVQQSGRASTLSLTLAAGLSVIIALLAFFTLNDPFLTSAGMAATTALAVAVSTDLRFGLLADLTSLIIAGAALMGAPLLTPGLNYPEMALSAGLSVGILALAGLYGRLRRGEMGLGAGDIVFAGALGLWCPTVAAALGVAIGAILTLLAGLAFKARADMRLPFGPGLTAGFILAFVLERLT